MSERRGDFILTYTGVRFWPIDPRPEEVNIADIAHALANLCRYTGHVSRFYSVAEHSCHVADCAPREDALWGLLHDATEAYIGDLARPIKHSDAGFGEAYQVAERRLMRAICIRFELPSRMPESVATFDDRVLETEAHALMPPLGRSWTGRAKVEGLEVAGWTPKRAEREFLRRFHNLTEVAA